MCAQGNIIYSLINWRGERKRKCVIQICVFLPYSFSHCHLWSDTTWAQDDLRTCKSFVSLLSCIRKCMWKYPANRCDKRRAVKVLTPLKWDKHIHRSKQKVSLRTVACAVEEEEEQMLASRTMSEREGSDEEEKSLVLRKCVSHTVTTFQSAYS